MNILILGAAGQIARVATQALLDRTEAKLTLYARNARRLGTGTDRTRILEGDVLDATKLASAMEGQDLVYANLSGNMEAQAKTIVSEMKAAGVHAIETRVKYLVDGTIVSPDNNFNTQLNDALWLNFSFLKSSRKAVLDAVLQWWRFTPNARQKVQQQINFRINAVEYQPFSPVAIWFLRQKL